MTTAISSTTTPKRNALANLAERIECDPTELMATLKSTVFKGATDAEFNALVIISNSYQLNPILKELYAFPAKGGGIVPVVGIDGWLKIINRQPGYDGMTVEISPDGQSATATIHVKERAHPTVVTEYLAECSRGTEPWKAMPRRMLRHKAIIQAARVAFGIGGIQDEDEAHDSMRDVTPRKGREIPAELQVDPFQGTALEALATEEPPAQPAPQPAAATKEAPLPANPATVPATGRQKKDRIERDAKYQTITEKSGKGKTWFVVAVLIEGKLVEFTTFSQTLADSLRGLDKGTAIRVTVTLSNPETKEFALEDYTLIKEEGMLV